MNRSRYNLADRPGARTATGLGKRDLGWSLAVREELRVGGWMDLEQGLPVPAEKTSMTSPIGRRIQAQRLEQRGGLLTRHVRSGEETR